jgi:hypothetical protein
MRKLAMIWSAAAVAALALLFSNDAVSAKAPGSGPPAVCLPGDCPATTEAPAAPALRISYTDWEKIDMMYQCCVRYVRGQPLKGLFCSSKYLNMAFSRNVVHIVVNPDGSRTCAPTGRPL